MMASEAATEKTADRAVSCADRTRQKQRFVSSRPQVLLLTLAALWGVGASRHTDSTERSGWLQAQIRSVDDKLPVAARNEKHAAMRTSPLAFFRGTAHLFFQDVGTSPQLAQFGGVPQTRTWLVGDAHPNNFGSFRNARGSLVYDLNDFDESVIADYQLDLWRMATALVLLMRENGGFASSDEAIVIDAFSEKYLRTLEGCVGSDIETTAALTAEHAYGKLDDFLQGVANKRGRTQLLDAYTIKDAQGQRALSPRASSDLAEVPPSVVEAVRAAMPAYGQSLRGSIAYSATRFSVKSVAERLHAGLGSLGSARYYVLIEGESKSPEDDLILDVKAQGTPSAYRNLSPASIAATEAACERSPALRVVTAARSLGSYADEYLGTMKIGDVRYSVRERSPWKDALDSGKLRSVERLSKLAEQWAMVLAWAHARADKDAPGSHIPQDFESEVTQRTRGKHAEFLAVVRSIAIANAGQVMDDFQAFVRVQSNPK